MTQGPPQWVKVIDLRSMAEDRTPVQTRIDVTSCNSTTSPTLDDSVLPGVRSKLWS